MKRFKILFVGLAAASSLALAACGGGAAPTPTQAPSPTATTAPAATTPPAATPNNGGNGGDPVARGQQLVTANACTACHSTDGTRLVGPTWQGLYGHEVRLADGSTVTADAGYIKESIVDPNAKIVEGFQPNIMPSGYGNTLSDSDLDAIVAYIESLE